MREACIGCRNLKERSRDIRWTADIYMETSVWQNKNTIRHAGQFYREHTVYPRHVHEMAVATLTRARGARQGKENRTGGWYGMSTDWERVKQA